MKDIKHIKMAVIYLNMSLLSLDESVKNAVLRRTQFHSGRSFIPLQPNSRRLRSAA